MIAAPVDEQPQLIAEAIRRWRKRLLLTPNR
ncbi:hypothetical protein SEEN4881_11056 [Salmonella enterica subsp. enterica serovar Newport str. WA_14881]|nr:hypothetical protein SEEN4881_11056 [Salmonella enterica subsp. enterica serovar Newport str. WA_14881]